MLMTPEQRIRMKALHEAGHAAVALTFGMLADGGMTIDENDEEAGGTYICWKPLDFRNAERVCQRATISMAGVAADVDRRKESPQWNACLGIDEQIDWYQVFCLCEDLRCDIKKARRLHVISERAESVWPAIEKILSSNASATEDEILDCLFSQPDLKCKYEQLPYETVGTYFNRATNVLSLNRAKHFVREAAKRLFEQGALSGPDCRSLWDDDEEAASVS
jgi:hypothetical protein